VRFHADKLQAPLGTHVVKIRVRPNAFRDDTLTLTVSVAATAMVTVRTPPAQIGYPAVAGSLVIENAGRGELSWRAVPVEPWIIVTNGSGVLPERAAETIRFTIDRYRTPRDTTGRINIVAEGVNSVSVDVRVRGQPSPELIALLPLGAVYLGDGLFTHNFTITEVDFRNHRFARSTLLSAPTVTVGATSHPTQLTAVARSGELHGIDLVSFREAWRYTIGFEPASLFIAGQPPNPTYVYMVPRSAGAARIEVVRVDQASTPVPSQDFPLPSFRQAGTWGAGAFASTSTSIARLRLSGTTVGVASVITPVNFDGADGRFWVTRLSNCDVLVTSAGEVVGLTPRCTFPPLRTPAGERITQVRDVHPVGGSGAFVGVVGSVAGSAPRVWILDNTGRALAAAPVHSIESAGQTVDAIPVAVRFLSSEGYILYRAVSGPADGQWFVGRFWLGTPAAGIPPA
jgi:hypothetical protein